MMEEQQSGPNPGDGSLKQLSRKRAAAIIVIGIVLAFTVYYGELTLRTQKEEAQQLKIPARGIDYYRPKEDRTLQIAEAEKTLRTGTGTWELVTDLVDSYDAAKKLKDGDRFFAEMQKKYPDNPQYLLGAGLIYLKIHAYNDADRHFSKALELEPDWIPALKGLANTRLYLKQPNQAKAIIEKAILLAQQTNHPLLGDILGNLATLHLLQSNIKDALTNQMEAITHHEQLNNNRALAIDYLNLAKIKLSLKASNEAKTILLKAIDYALLEKDKILELQGYGLMIMICQQDRDQAAAKIYLAKGKQLASELGIPETMMPQQKQDR